MNKKGLVPRCYIAQNSLFSKKCASSVLDTYKWSQSIR